MRTKRHLRTFGLIVTGLTMLVLVFACGQQAPPPAPAPTLPTPPTPAPAPAPRPAPAPAPAPAPKPAPQTRPVVLKTVTALPTNSFSNVGLWVLRDKVKEISKGELTINILGGPEVIAVADQGTAVKKGVVDLAHIFAAGYAGLVPIAMTLGLSPLTPSEELVPGGYYDFMAEQHAKAGLFYLGRGSLMEGLNTFNILLKKAISRPSELNGVKIGGISPLSNSFLKELGAIPVSLTPPEVYIALDTGVVDGYWDTYNTFVAMRLHEQKVWVIDHPYYQNNMTFIMNPDSFNQLPAHLKDVLKRAEMETLKVAPAMYLQEINKNKKIMLDAGVQLISFPAEDARRYVDSAYAAEWVNQLQRNPDTGPRAKQLLTK